MVKPAAIGTLLAALLVTSACAPEKAAVRHSASPTGAAANPVRASATPSADPGCRLPVVQWTQMAQGAVAAGGFMQVPGGEITPDPNSGFVQDGLRYRSTIKPYLNGGGPGSGSYDWGLARWLPASPRTVSPDGSRYAYSSDFGFIHVVDIATGLDRAFKAPDGPDTLMYYAREGIYFNHAWEGPPGPGLWLLDPDAGTVQTLFSDKAVDTVGGYAAWLPDVNPADPHPVFSQYSGSNMPNRILRRDLNGGPTVSWFYRPGRSLAVVGFDQDKHPLVVVETLSTPDSAEVWQVTAANAGRKIYSGPQVPTIMADAHGIWLADPHGVSLFTVTSGLTKVSALAVDIVGACR